MTEDAKLAKADRDWVGVIGVLSMVIIMGSISIWLLENT